jgi:hypothetical protein
MSIKPATVEGTDELLVAFLFESEPSADRDACYWPSMRVALDIEHLQRPSGCATSLAPYENPRVGLQEARTVSRVSAE